MPKLHGLRKMVTPRCHAENRRMADEVKLPALGENVPGGDVVDIKVAVGDTIAQGQELIEVEAEKSTVPVPSPVAGKVTKVLVKKGQKVTTGQGIVVVESTNGKAAAPAVDKTTQPHTPEVPKDEPPLIKQDAKATQELKKQPPVEAKPTPAPRP